MESDLGKLFIGGISWDTDEDRLKQYFGTYGEVVDAVIMRDRTTGRARGFGFVVFADAVVAERVVMEKHMIDGRTVEAKKAVPRNDHHITNRNNNSSNQGSPGLGRTKKIFVGGLASTVTESDFKNYFDQFGTIMDVVVMYDHNTQRPRGFGFITFDSEEAVDWVLHKTFHELNGKMVEVKRAVPKELSPGTNRSSLVGYNYNLTRANNLLNNYAQGYNLSPVGGYGVRMDGRFNPIASGRIGFSPLGSPSYGMGLNLGPGLSSSFGESSNLNNNLGYGRFLSPYQGGNSNRYNTPIGYNGGNVWNDSLLSPSTRMGNLWGNGGLDTSASNSIPVPYLGSRSGSYGVLGNSSRLNWGSSSISSQGTSSLGYNNRNIGPEVGENSFGFGGRENTLGLATSSSLVGTIGDYDDRLYGDLYYGDSMRRDPTWQSVVSSRLDDSDSLGYGLGNAADVTVNSSEGYVGNYSITDRQSNRGIAT